jgi:hypothetical protein
MKTLKFKFYADPGHGWLACKVDLLRQLGINKNISGYSYVKGNTAYLEEDCDASKLIDALKAANIEYKIEVKNTNRSSPIRSYNRYGTDYEPAPQSSTYMPSIVISSNK